MIKSRDYTGELVEPRRKLRTVDVIATVLGTILILSFLIGSWYFTKEVAEIEDGIINAVKK